MHQIKHYREKLRLTQEDLAKKLNVHPRTVSHWEQGHRSPSSSQRKKLIQIFNISEAELFGGIRYNDIPIQKVPIISWIHANQFSEIEDPYEPGFADEWVETSIKGKKIIALKVQNDCMEPEFVEEDVIVVDPEANIENGDFVIVADRDSNKATFKQYKKYGNKIILKPLNSKYPEIELDRGKRYEIVGKVRAKEKIY